jgi:hypothetical protein
MTKQSNGATAAEARSALTPATACSSGENCPLIKES